MTTARVLLVDDEAVNRDMLSRRLERRGYSVGVAASGAEVLVALKLGLGLFSLRFDRDAALADRRLTAIIVLRYIAQAAEQRAVIARCGRFWRGFSWRFNGRLVLCAGKFFVLRGGRRFVLRRRRLRLDFWLGRGGRRSRLLGLRRALLRQGRCARSRFFKRHHGPERRQEGELLARVGFDNNELCAQQPGTERLREGDEVHVIGGSVAEDEAYVRCVGEFSDGGFYVSDCRGVDDGEAEAFANLAHRASVHRRRNQ